MGQPCPSVQSLSQELREPILLPVIDDERGYQTDGPAVGDIDEDAIVALQTLGFSRAESAKAVASARAKGASGIEDIIMQALKSL